MSRLPTLTGPLATLEPAAISALQSVGTWQTHPPGTELLAQGSESDEVHIVSEGSVRVVLTRPDGPRLLLGIRGPGAALGDLSVVGKTRRSASVVALEEVTALRIAGETFLGFVRNHPDCLLAMLAELGRRLRESERRLADVGGHSPRVRLARQLLEHAMGDDAELDFDGQVALPLNAGDLADWIKATAAEADDAVRALQKANLVATWGTGLKITDVDGLRVAALL